MTPRKAKTWASVVTGERAYAPAAAPVKALLKVTADVPLMNPVAAMVVGALNVTLPMPTAAILVPAGMPVPETGMPTRKPVVFASGKRVPATVCDACADGAALMEAIVVEPVIPAPVTVCPTARPKVFLTMSVVPEPVTGVKVVGSPRTVRRKPMVFACDMPATAEVPTSVWRK